jgi:hypothetical protein
MMNILSYEVSTQRGQGQFDDPDGNGIVLQAAAARD